MYIIIASIIFVIHAVFVPIYLYLTWNFKYWKQRGLHTALPMTLFGTYPSIITRSRNMIFDMLDVYEKYKNKHRAVGIFVTRQPQILILEPKLAHDVLVQNFSQYRDTITSAWVNNRKAEKYVSRNPFWSAGDEWKRRRADAQGGVTLNKLKQAHTIWQSSGRKLSDFMAQEISTKGNKLETKDLSYRFCADVMSDFIWGIDAGTLTKSNEPNMLQKTCSKWTQHAFTMMSCCFILMIAPFVRKFGKFRFYPKSTDEFFSKLTRDAVKMREQQLSTVQRSDYLSHLLQLREQKQISHDDMVGHALTVMLDGYETTGMALMHTLYDLASNPRVQTKLRAEIMKNVEDVHNISYDSLTNLPYLEQCIYESLRIVSLIPSFSRICTKSTTLELSGNKMVAVEKGMVITVPAYAFHHDDNYFPEPEQYKPERFDNAAHLELIKQGILLPFGDGPRICMGNRVALLTIKTALIHLLSEYEISLAKGEQKKTNASSFVLTLEGDVMLEYKTIK